MAKMIVVRGVIDGSCVDEFGLVRIVNKEYEGENRSIVSFMNSIMHDIRYLEETPDFYLHSVILSLENGQDVRILTRCNRYENGLKRECQMQEIWAWYLQSPSLTRMEIGSQQLYDAYATSMQIEKFERMAMEMIND